MENAFNLIIASEDPMGGDQDGGIRRLVCLRSGQRRQSTRRGTAKRRSEMPIYEFLCRNCEKPFERIWSLDEYDRILKGKGVKCPKCGSEKVVRQISAVQVRTSKKS
jgi:putative FmdB family regulatory protein